MVSLNFKISILSLVALVLFQTTGALAEGTEPEKNETERLVEKIQSNPEFPNFVTQDDSLYMDLNRELELAKRERQRHEGQDTNETDLKKFNEELAGRVKELQQVREDLSKQVEKKKENNPNLQYLVGLYESIKPVEAAELLKRLPLTVTVTMMQMMNPKKTSKILSAMDPKLATEISRRVIRSTTAQLQGVAK